MIARFLIVALFFVLTNSIPTSDIETLTPPTQAEFPTFEQYCRIYNKHYASHEIAFRQAVYENTVAQIQQHNAKQSTHTKGINKFSDLTPAEMSKYFGYSKNMAYLRKQTTTKKPSNVRSELFKNRTVNYNGVFPSSFDWTTYGATTPVKNQGQCGSCWAFAGTEALESDVFLETGSLLVLAPQFYVDCVPNPLQCGGTGGCNGATDDLLYEYAAVHGGVLETEYPYTANETTCRSIPPKVTIESWVDVAANNDTALIEAVLIQPVTISVAASNWGTYTGGVFEFSECDADINHNVLLVGYGTDPKLGDYWKIQNSWGPDWGENGFVRLQRSSNCATDNKPLDGFGCAGGPPSITVCGTCGMLSSTVYPVGGRVVRSL